MTAWLETIDAATAARIAGDAHRSGLLAPGAKSFLVHDLGLMRARIETLKAAFPASALHAVAIKANPLIGVLRQAVACGAGTEAASLEELRVGLAAGCDPQRLVFDSPAKTAEEIAEAIEAGVMMNADSFDELERIEAVLGGARYAPGIGLRVNPEVGGGRIAITSVARRGSKFGVALGRSENRIIAAFERLPWLNGLHVHVGSQGCEVELLVEAAARIDALRRRIDRQLGAGRVAWVDIGGGLPARYMDTDVAPDIDDYASCLRARVPGLLDGSCRVVTELGRALQANCGLAMSRVEYVKPMADTNVAIIHLGADALMRPVYQPEHWAHRMTVLDARFRPKPGPSHSWTVAGPLCFAGDVVARDRALPQVEPGDWIVIHDVGAYTLSMWSRHCSRAIPPVLGFDAAGDPPFRLLLRGETPMDVVAFWNEPDRERP